MRITGGAARGIPLKTSDKGVRPATDRMREALFSSLGERITGANFVDLFAGAGSYGLEAISRGAASGTFVEKHPKACQFIKSNLSAVLKSISNVKTSPQPNSSGFKVVKADALRWQITAASVDVIFCDPPYELTANATTQLAPLLKLALRAEGMLCFEMPGSVPDHLHGWELIRKLGKGDGDQPTMRLYQPLADGSLSNPAE